MRKKNVMPATDRPPPLWRNRDYMLLWSGQLVSNVGTQVSQLAFPLLILALTHSPAQAGFAGALRTLPYLLFSLPAGALVDRWDRKRVMIVCDTGRALALASIPIALLLGRLTIGQIFVVTALEGTFYVFFNIAEAACLPRVVPKVQLSAAVAQNFATDSIMVLIGPPIGGFLYAVGQLFPFLCDALTYAVSVISLLFIKRGFQEKREAAPNKHLWVEIREGLSWLWHHPLIRFIALLTGGNNLITSGYTLIIIVLAQHMHASSLLIGLGLVLAAALVAGSIYNIVQFSYRSALIPDELQGRVNSVFRLIAFGGQPPGIALIGVLLQGVGVVQTIAFCSLGLVALAVMTTMNTHIRHARPLTEMNGQLGRIRRFHKTRENYLSFVLKESDPVNSRNGTHGKP
jgi:MFS family permease